MKIEGKLIEKFDTKQVSGSFKKREFVVEFAENPLYPQTVLFQLTQDKCEMLDGFEKGQMVGVEFNLRGRSWTAPDGEVKYFNSLEAWRVEGAGKAVAQPAKNSGSSIPPVSLAEEGDDDLPF